MTLAWSSMRAMREILTGRRPDIASTATDRWEVASSSPVEVRKARFLPGQLERIRATRFGTVQEVVRDLTGGFETMQGPTMAYRLKDALLRDGVLYSGGAERHLKLRSRSRFTWIEPEPHAGGALYESWSGNRWFGNWLCDDCLTYRLAEFAGRPVVTAPPTGHKIDYEGHLAMSAERVSATYFAELIVFDDQPHNENKRWRATDLRRRLVGEEPPSHPGVFLLRGNTGDRRILVNEHAIAEHLEKTRGIRTIDPRDMSVREIVDACGGARAVIGVEGSHLVHGLMLLPPEGRALVIQPPGRAVSVLKLITDRQGQDFSFVVGVGNDESFSASIEEIERTLDLA